MKSLMQKFLSKTDREEIQEAVRQAELTTSGEIVPMVVSSSYTYPMADVLGAAAFSLPLSIIATIAAGNVFWLGSQNMWIFIGLFGLLFAGFYEIIKRTSWLKRLFVAGSEMDAEVKEAAESAFFKEGLHRTRHETGILIFISIFERRVWVLADRGINAKVPQDAWNNIVDQITAGIRRHRQCKAICEAIQTAGRLLTEHFPVQPDDTDELQNLIIPES
jgi:putative membrane protein